MEQTINLRVDFEDKADWLQDSIVLENVILPEYADRGQFMVELEQAVYDNTRDCYNPPSSHIRITGYAPADSDVTVKRGLNFWTDDDNIFAN